MTNSAPISCQDAINAYKCGLFPMAGSADASDYYWYDPPARGVISISELHIPRRLMRTIRQFLYEVKIDTAFAKTIDHCAAPAKGRMQTWINKGIRDLFVELHGASYAHSVECWHQGVLVGGLYGLAIGGAFMGESMFSTRRDASKIALVHLCARLWKGGFTLLDTQFVNPHIMQFGAHEIPREEYLMHLHRAINIRADFILNGQSEAEIVNEFLAQKKNASLLK